MKYPGSPERIMELLGELRIAFNSAPHALGPAGDFNGLLLRLHSELAEEISQTPYAKLIPGEPFFFLRAQDALFGETVVQYADRFVGMGGSVDDYGELVRLAGAGVTWQSQNPALVKVAD